MERVLDDSQLRMEMRAAGRIQASRFSWRAMTDQTVASYAPGGEATLSGHLAATRRPHGSSRSPSRRG